VSEGQIQQAEVLQAMTEFVELSAQVQIATAWVTAWNANQEAK
jgi:hypothetical protein